MEGAQASEEWGVGSTTESIKDCRKWGAPPGVQRTAGSGEHHREYRGLQGVGSTVAYAEDCWWQWEAGEKHISSSISKVL